MTDFRQTLASHFRTLVQVERHDIFGAADADYMPKNLPDDSRTMFAGFVGADYRAGRGLLLLAINPGGGGDAYTARTAEDEVFYPLLHAFKASGEKNAGPVFERINEAFAPIVQRWNLWRILGPTLNAAGRTLNEVAYMNVVPYRTRGDKMPPAVARRASWSLIGVITESGV